MAEFPGEVKPVLAKLLPVRLHLCRLEQAQRLICLRLISLSTVAEVVICLHSLSYRCVQGIDKQKCSTVGLEAEGYIRGEDPAFAAFSSTALFRTNHFFRKNEHPDAVWGYHLSRMRTDRQAAQPVSVCLLPYVCIPVRHHLKPSS